MKLKLLLGLFLLHVLLCYGLGRVLVRLLRLRRARSWEAADGCVLESHLFADPDQKGLTQISVGYAFITQAGDEVIGTTPRLCGEWFWTKRGQDEFVTRFTPGEEVEVYYDPANPSRNCLDRTDTGTPLLKVALYLVGILILSLILAPYCGKQP